MALQIRDSITTRLKKHIIFSPTELSNMIDLLVRDDSGAFKENFDEVRGRYPQLNNDDFEAFVFFSFALLLDYKEFKNIFSELNGDDITKFIYYIRANNAAPNDYYDLCDKVYNNHEAFLEFFKNVISNRLQLMLLYSWVEIFTDVDKEMNAIRDISVGNKTGYEKVITMEKMAAVGYADSSRLFGRVA